MTAVHDMYVCMWFYSSASMFAFCHVQTMFTTLGLQLHSNSAPDDLVSVHTLLWFGLNFLVNLVCLCRS